MHLALERNIERRMYNTLPHGMETLVTRHPPRCRVHFIFGTHSNEMHQVATTPTRRLAGPNWHTVAGGHLFPMERPEETAWAVLEALEG